MLGLKNFKWALFNIGDFFQFRSGNADDITTRESNIENGIPIISSKDSNNGVCGFFKKKNYESIYENVLTLNKDGSAGYCYFHKYKFLATGHVKVLINKKNLSENCLKFLSVCIQKVAIPKFSFSYAASDERLLKTKILLPVDNERNPNWSFMENYIRELEKKKINEILSHLNHTHTHQVTKNVGNFSCLQWRLFNVCNFFNIKRGNANNTTDITIEYSRNQVAVASAKKNNNSIYGFTIPKRNETIYKDILTVNNTGDGGAGYSYYHNYSVIVSSTVSVLLPKTKISPSSLKFLSMCIQNVTIPKFSFAYSASDERLLKTKILLPVDKNNNPDWEYMENYIRNLESIKIKKVIDHLKRKIKFNFM